MDFYQFSSPTKIVFSEGLAKDFSAELETIGIDKYFIVTDKVLTDLKIVDPIVEGLKEAGKEVCGLFDDVPPDSGVKVIEKCAEQAKLSGAEGIIAIGGGSVMDTAKGANILFSLGGDLVEDYSGAQTISEDLMPLIAIPTTAGTGSEVTEAIVILEEKSSTKLSFVDAHMMPTLAILDPELTIGLPPKVTAATGIDAMTHAIESMMSVQKAPVPDALALMAIRFVKDNLVVATKDGSNLEARGKMLTASTLAGMAFNHSMVGVVHAVAHTIGGMFHVHHGTANGIFLPYGMEYNLEERTTEIASMAPSLGVEEKGEPLEVAKGCIQAVRELLGELNQACGLPITLKAVDVPQDKLSKIAEKAPDDGACFYNPREVEAEALMPYLTRAYEGN